eukprot:gnl/MRDRNA2_/MRDRNA2_130996_c0_seq1.p1 gnl/MRDRNA2_/MRDRNA2_130996_c0~~gnl/MRDRNA2_/MRDRNA2_130996_c0_seq1.p1  ORF type:complete len:473 (+),score=82.11 gnl/MRDRNA2_/MRDRNA2_130996_c0_seq1:69-1421(+)
MAEPLHQGFDGVDQNLFTRANAREDARHRAEWDVRRATLKKAFAILIALNLASTSRNLSEKSPFVQPAMSVVLYSATWPIAWHLSGCIGKETCESVMGLNGEVVAFIVQGSALQLRSSLPYWASEEKEVEDEEKHEEKEEDEKPLKPSEEDQKERIHGMLVDLGFCVGVYIILKLLMMAATHVQKKCYPDEDEERKEMFLDWMTDVQHDICAITVGTFMAAAMFHYSYGEEVMEALEKGYTGSQGVYLFVSALTALLVLALLAEFVQAVRWISKGHSGIFRKALAFGMGLACHGLLLGQYEETYSYAWPFMVTCVVASWVVFVQRFNKVLLQPNVSPFRHAIGRLSENIILEMLIYVMALSWEWLFRSTLVRSIGSLERFSYRSFVYAPAIVAAVLTCIWWLLIIYLQCLKVEEHEEHENIASDAAPPSRRRRCLHRCCRVCNQCLPTFF